MLVLNDNRKLINQMADRNNLNKFLGNEFVSSFGNSSLHPCKKPKLDVTLSQVSASSVQKFDQLSAVAEKNDVSVFNENDVWGEDFDENEVNQCFLVESQALSQDISIEKNIEIKIQPSVTPQLQQLQNVVNNTSTPKGTPLQRAGKTPVKTGTPLFRAASAGNVQNTQIKSSGYVSTCSSSISGKFNAEGAAIHLQSQVTKFKDECRNLRDQLQSKEGEVKNLRTALSRSKSEHIKKNHCLLEQLNKVKDDSTRRISELDKQLKDLRTELEFKSMELKSLEEKLKKSRDQVTSADSPRPSSSRKSLDLNKTIHGEKRWKELGLEEISFDFGNMSVHVNEGSLLAKLIEPEFYMPLFSDGCPSKGSLCDKDPKKENNSTDALRDCFQPLMMLYKIESFSATYSARKYIKKILDECYKTLQEHLQSMKDRGPEGQLVNRSKELLQKSHTILPLTERYSLLSSQNLHEDEKGIKVRRILGLVDVLVKVSCETAKLILDSNVFVQTGNSSDNVNNDSNNNTGDSCNNIKGESEELSTIHETKDVQLFGKSILHVLRDLVLLISSERRTLQYNGVLVAATILVTSIVERRLDLSEKWQTLLLQIVQHILAACPGPAVVFQICRFLLFANYYCCIVNNLCVSSVDKGEVEYERCYIFKKDTCPVTVLCYIVQAMEQDKRYLITDVITQWFLDLLRKEDQNFLPHWLIFSKEEKKCDSQKDCACPWNLSKLITTLLCEAALYYHHNDKNRLDNDVRILLERLLERGLWVLFLMLRHTSFGLNLGYIEGQYQLFIHTLSMLEPGLPLRPFLKEIMEQLVIGVEKKAPEGEETPDPAQRKYLENEEDLNNAIFSN